MSNIENPNLTATKPAVASTGVWGGVIAVIAGIAGLFGYAVTEADQHTLSQAVTAGAAAIGGAVAVWGRLRATKKIG